MSSKVTTRRPTPGEIDLAIQQFVASRRNEQEPPRGTVVWQLWQGQRLTARHAWAAGRFYDDVVIGLADRGKVKAVDLASDKVDGSRVIGMPGRLSPEERATKRLARLSKYIRPSEHQLVIELVRDYHQGEIARKAGQRRFEVHLDLEALGRIVSGYAGRAQAKAAGTARLQALLDVFADFYDSESQEARS